MVAVASGKQDAVDARDLVGLVEQIGTLAYRYQRSNVVEEIDEEEHKDDFQKPIRKVAGRSSLKAVREVAQTVPVWAHFALGGEPIPVVARMPINIGRRSANANRRR